MENNEGKMTLKMAEKLLAEEMVGYLKDDGNTKLYWTDSMTHLMEVAHYVYMLDILKDDMGCSISQKQIVERICRQFHVVMPSNLYSYINRNNNKKGVKSKRLVDIMLYQSNTGKPLLSISKFLHPLLH